MGYYDPNGTYIYDLGEPFDPSIVPQRQPGEPDRQVPPGAQPPPLDVEGMIARDTQAWRQMLQAATQGLNFADPTRAVEEELPSVLSWVRAHPGQDPVGGVNEAIARLKRRGASVPGGDTNVPGGGTRPPSTPATTSSGFPTPTRPTMPKPERASVYTPAFKASMVQAPTEVGRPQRDRILTAILDRPETLDQTAQDQIFEQQKELATELAKGQRARLAQAVLQGGMQSTGGRSLAGQAAIEETMGNTLVGARRDVALKAVEQNRKDQMAALEMQQAIANGDHARALEIFKANEASRVQEEEFLAQAADLNSRNLNAYNDALLKSALAQQGGDMDYFQFLEMQRQFESRLAKDYFDIYHAGTR